MTKTRKSRACGVSVEAFYGTPNYDGARTVYYAAIPYDKRGREIPSSVNCCYNADYFHLDDIFTITQSL